MANWKWGPGQESWGSRRHGTGRGWAHTSDHPPLSGWGNRGPEGRNNPTKVTHGDGEETRSQVSCLLNECVSSASVGFSKPGVPQPTEALTPRILGPLHPTRCRFRRPVGKATSLRFLSNSEVRPGVADTSRGENFKVLAKGRWLLPVPSGAATAAGTGLA